MKIKKPKDLLKIKGPWYHKQFNAYPLTLGCIATGAVQCSADFLPVYQKFGICFYTKTIADWYWHRAGQLRVRSSMIASQINNPNYIVRLNKNRHKEFVLYEKAITKFYKLDLRKLSDKELWLEYSKVLKPLYRQWGWGMISEPFLGTEEDWFADELRDDLQKKFGSKWNSLLPIIGLPDKPSFVNEEHNSILDIAIYLSKQADILRAYKSRGVKYVFSRVKDNKKLWHKLVKHTQEFFWVEDNYSVWRKYNEFYFFKKAIVFSINDPIKVKRDEAIRFRKQLSKKRKILRELSTRSRNLVILANVLSESSDERKTTSFRSAKMWFSLAGEVARRGKLSEQDVLHMLDLELKHFLLTGKVDKKSLKERQSQCLLVHLPLKNLMFSGKYLQKVKPSDFEEVGTKTTTIRGVVASHGFAKGVVRVVIRHDEISKVKKGEILVTNNTTPDYVPAMRKAAAIVTEQGGITSHAAIISRELGVPCIIGTKIGSKVLKSGDKVSLDLVKGTVVKLKR